MITSGLPVTGLITLAGGTLPPSVTFAADAVSVTVVASASSVTFVVTVPVVVSDSKLPPLVPVIAFVITSVPWMYACPRDARTGALARQAPAARTRCRAGIVIVVRQRVITSGN